MANALTTAIGRINSTASTPLALTTDQAGYDAKYGTYLKLFSGELFKGFQTNTIARDLVTKRTLKNGKSLQFIYTGRMSAAYHTPGTPILGTENALPVAEKTIQMDDLLISSAFVYDLDETLAHYDLRGEISKKIGFALAEKYDRLIFRAITRGARKASPVSATNKKEPGGTQIQVGAGADANDALVGSNLVDAFYDAAAALDEKGVSAEGRCGVISPRQYYALINDVSSGAISSGIINRDVQGSALQSGSGVIEIAGIKLYKSMNIPFLSKYGTAYKPSSGNNDTIHTNTTDPGNTGDWVSAATEDADIAEGGINNNYGEATNFANSCGLIFQREAAGVVEAIGPQVQVTSGDVSVIYQGDVILGRMAMGADYLNPAACVELFAGVTTKPAAY
jgi:hypothetical protein